MSQKPFGILYGAVKAIGKNVFSRKPPFGVFHLIFGFQVDFHCTCTYTTPAPDETDGCRGKTLKSNMTGGFKVSKHYLWFTFSAIT
jgi:hypothetical protein